MVKADSPAALPYLLEQAAGQHGGISSLVKHQMIQQEDIQPPQRPQQRIGVPHILRRGGGHSGGMIVRQHHPCGVVPQRQTDQSPHADLGGIDAAPVQQLHAHAPGLAVHQQDIGKLVPLADKARSQNGGGRIQRAGKRADLVHAGILPVHCRQQLQQCCSMQSHALDL